MDFSHHRCAKCFLSYAFIHRPLLLLLLLLLSLSGKGLIFIAHYQIYLCFLFGDVTFNALLQKKTDYYVFRTNSDTLLKTPRWCKGLAAEVDMSDVNLFRCIREGSIKAQDLERIAKALDVSITEFFPDDKSYLSIGNNAVSSHIATQSKPLQFPREFVF